MATSTVEDYLKQIFLMETAEGAGPLVPMGQLAQILGVVPGTATSMIKTLAEAGLVKYEPRTGVCLSPKGRKLALHVLRRHRMVELFLVKVLGMDWSEIHDEAERLEHAISDRVMERIDELLGRPTLDPHGDPIPDAEGKMGRRELVPLVSAEGKGWVEVARVKDQTEVFLRFVDRNGLKPGRRLQVVAVDAVAGVVTVEPEDGSPLSLGLETAGRIEVEQRTVGVVDEG